MLKSLSSCNKGLASLLFSLCVCVSLSVSLSLSLSLLHIYLVVERAAHKVSFLEAVFGALVRADSLERLVVVPKYDGVRRGVKVVQVFPCNGIQIHL